MVRLLDLARPFQGLLPQVVESTQKTQMREKVIWTGITLFIYLVCSQIPLYGVNRAKGADAYYWMRVILASNRGSLMELGISPLVTASMIMQLLAGIKFINVNMQVKSDRALFNTAQRVLGIAIAVSEGFAYIWSGAYGAPSKLGAGNCLIILLQLSFSGVIVSLLDDLLNKGYGLGSGISLFIATNICENIVWKSFSPMTLSTQSGTEFEGSIINLIHLLLTKPGLAGLYDAFYRVSAPNLNNLLATVLVFLVVIYFQGFKNEIQLINQKYRGVTQSFPIKLFYTSNIPIILQSALVSNLYFFSQILWKKFQGNYLVRLLGQWQELEYGGQSVPVGGLAYYISPPKDFNSILSDPIRFVTYVTFIMVACGLFARYWIEISGEGPKDIAKKLKEQYMTIKGHRQETSLKRELSKRIPVAAACGGMCVGLLTIMADFMGAIGSGTGILLAVTIIYGYFEQFQKDKSGATDFEL
ncbi:SecY subunit domain [Pseudocohnilembus persalinus]|uniref:SecY subunit domain n=1 Tax=Pseudocohnilembus persalinus TaxID=266149 RepID=A0A0V0QWJ8_PSEPJ|nr:SecY subunit domain [Pseudocohnilembus persalinus]|eukprot:KRX06610.1 SecY subunit domain [Pseudocohnilembus persalinus]